MAGYISNPFTLNPFKVKDSVPLPTLAPVKTHGTPKPVLHPSLLAQAKNTPDVPVPLTPAMRRRRPITKLKGWG